MPIDFSSLVYAPAYNTFARVIKVIPLASQPGGRPYDARGILDTAALDVGGLDETVISEQRIILDVRDAEFAVVPRQNDQVDIPADGGLPDQGRFEVIDATINGGGETTLVLRRVVSPDP